jgi:hypothetical protein
LPEDDVSLHDGLTVDRFKRQGIALAVGLIREAALAAANFDLFIAGSVLLGFD